MSPVERAGGTPGDVGVSPHLLDPLLAKRLNEQNIWQVLGTLPGEYTKQDILDYLKLKNNQLNDLIQDYKTMATYAEPRECTVDIIPEMNPKMSFTKEDHAEIGRMFSEFEGKGRVKFATAPKTAGGATEKDKAPSGAEIVEDGENLLREYQDWMGEYESKIFEIQLQMEMEKKEGELKAELQKIIAMVRSGQVDAVFLLVALAKVNCEKNGLLFTQLGKKLSRMNEESNKIVNDLYAQSPDSPQYAANLQMSTQKQKEVGMATQFLINDMSKVTQNIESTMGFAKTAIDDVFKTRLHIINAPFKSL